MARVFVPDDQLDNPAAYVYATYRPEIAQGASVFTGAVYQHTQLPFRIVEAARLRTAQINGCQTCQTFRAKRDLAGTLGKRGGDVSRSFIARGDEEPDDAFYAAVGAWQESDVFTERERLAIEYAERMGTDPHSFESDDELWIRMHDQFEDAEIVDLTLCISCWIAAGRALHALGIDPAVCSVEPAHA